MPRVSEGSARSFEHKVTLNDEGKLLSRWQVGPEGLAQEFSYYDDGSLRETAVPGSDGQAVYKHVFDEDGSLALSGDSKGVTEYEWEKDADGAPVSVAYAAKCFIGKNEWKDYARTYKCMPVDGGLYFYCAYNYPSSHHGDEQVRAIERVYRRVSDPSVAVRVNARLFAPEGSRLPFDYVPFEFKSDRDSGCRTIACFSDG